MGCWIWWPLWWKGRATTMEGKQPSFMGRWWPNIVHFSILLLLIAFDAPTFWLWAANVALVATMAFDLWLLRRRLKRERQRQHEEMIEFYRRLDRLQR